MRIALISSQWPGVRLGGIGVYTRHCAGALAAAGHEVHVFTLPLPADVRPKDAAYSIHEIDEAALPGLLSQALPMGDQLKYRMALQRAFADGVAAVHAKTPLDIIEAPEYEAPAKVLIERQLVPVVTHLHSGTAIIRELASQSGQAAAMDQEHALLEALELEVLAGSDGLCAPSTAVARDTEAAYRLSDLVGHAEVIPLPFPLSEKPFEMPPPDAPLLFVGRLEQLKGVHLLAEAAVTFLRQNPAARLHIAGPDTLDAPVERAGGGGGGRNP